MRARAATWLRTEPGGAGLAALTLAVVTGALVAVPGDRNLANVSLLYLLVTLLAAAGWGYRVGLATAVVADVVVNFFFVAPVHRFTVQDPANVVALGFFLAVAGVGAAMLSRLRRQARIAEARRAEAAAVLDLTTELAHASPPTALYRLCVAVSRALGARGTAILLQDDRWRVAATTGDESLTQDDIALARASVEGRQLVRQRPKSPVAPGGRSELTTFVPLPRGVPGVLRIRGDLRTPAFVDADRLLGTFASEAALAIERARLAEEARRTESLRRADETKSALLSSVSHDLRSPLTAIKAAVGSLRDHAIAWSDEDRDGFLGAIESQADRLAATVDHLLQMSRLEGGVVEPRLEPIEVAALLEDAAQLTRSQLAGRPPLEVAQAESLWVEGDYQLLLQSLVNLIENAARYSKPGGAIRLAAQRSRGRLELSVADEGPGIPPEDLARIFEKFYRGSTAGKVRGSGLGLSIVRAMVELCGGTIEVASSPAGSVFTIRLVAARPPVP